MIVTEFCDWDIRRVLSHNYMRISWDKRISILMEIAIKLKAIQSKQSHICISINDIGLGPKLNNDLLPVFGNNKINLLRYAPPELFTNKYSYNFEIYTFGMLMWEFSTNYPPFYDKIFDD